MCPSSSRPADVFSRVALTFVLIFAGVSVMKAAEISAPVPLGTAPNAVELAVFPFLPAGKNATGAGVLIVPDADFSASNRDETSLALGRWLADRGLATFVLRRASASARSETAGADVARALEGLRGRAPEFKLDAARLGLLGLGQGATALADVAYGAKTDPSSSANAAAGNEAGKVVARPAFVALVWGSPAVASVPANAPPTFLVGSTLAGDNLSGLIDLWTKLRAARVSVDAHFFARRDPASIAAVQEANAVSWPEMFYAWARFQGFLTEQPRIALKGMAYLDGHPLPQGYVIFTPVDFVGAGPIVARVINSTAGAPIGEFSVPASQGPIAGRYRVEVRQNMNWWLSNAFSGPLVNARNGVTPEQAYFGHHRILAPSIADQRVFTKMRPTDRQDYLIEFTAAAAHEDLKIEVFTK